MIVLWIAAAVASTSMVQPPKLVGDKSFIRADDYPEDALRSGSYGRVSLHLQITAEGRVSACAVTETSRSRSLDIASCFAATHRARFEPARDAGGQAVQSDYRVGLVFGIDDHQPLLLIPMTLGVKALPPGYTQPAHIRVWFGPDGRATHCDTAKSTGSTFADEMICQVIRRDLVIQKPISSSAEPPLAVRTYLVTLSTVPPK